jgi:hypothetical protein
VCLLMKIRSAHAHFGMRRPLEAFELSASAWHHGKIKRNEPRPQKKIVDLWSGSSLRANSKCLKVPHSSVQTIVRKYKRSRHTSQEGESF